MEPINKQRIERVFGEKQILNRNIVGEVEGLTEKEIRHLGLYITVTIHTDTWYPQGETNIDQDGKWRLKGHFYAGETDLKHTIKAELKDHDGKVYSATQIDVYV